MTEEAEIDYGPLAQLIGVWEGDKGLDIAPEPDGTEENPYFETITYTAVGDVTNAEKQTLVGIHYVQVVRRKSDEEVFHHQTGYWIWDAEAETVANSFVIPRAVGVLAGGKVVETDVADRTTTFDVVASIDSEDWSIVQSPFMRENARTTSFSQLMEIGADTLTYRQTTMLEIYGTTFEHTDENELRRQ
jgi:hypothetical protein